MKYQITEKEKAALLKLRKTPELSTAQNEMIAQLIECFEKSGVDDWEFRLLVEIAIRNSPQAQPISTSESIELDGRVRALGGKIPHGECASFEERTVYAEILRTSSNWHIKPVSRLTARRIEKTLVELNEML